ncbi:MAG: UvrB/UvrC motif-containing protein, partial [Treponema sp.]|nr:UvrB/UvrC motif-containing protein [Treponema sp.]
IGRCLAPCCGKVEEAAYAAQVERVRKLLAGETSSLLAELNAKMTEAAKTLKYEEAAEFRNAIKAIENLSENNSVADMDPEDRDYIAWAAEGIFTTFSVLSMRGGRMTGRELYSSRSAAEITESLETFVAVYYTPDRSPPPRIYLMNSINSLELSNSVNQTDSNNQLDSNSEADSDNREDSINQSVPNRQSSLTGSEIAVETLNRFFGEQFGITPELIISSELSTAEKRHIAALSMARQNAQEELRRRLRERGAGPALDELVRVLGLKTRPENIEGFDIAQLDGKHPVASLITFKNGIPDRRNYRYFKLKTVVGIVDDFASMREAVHRRYSRLIHENKELPDLVLIDGGIGQVNAAKGVMDELGIDCDIIGLAKRDEELWLPHTAEPVKLSKRSEALKVLQFVRDETHRFATGLNQRLRSKDLYFPVLESLEGIGPKRAAAIMKTYGELEKIAAAEPDEMAETCNITKSAAEAVRAAARLALEDQKAKKKEFKGTALKKTRVPGTERYSASSRRKAADAAALAEEAALEDGAFAAEEGPVYGDE